MNKKRAVELLNEIEKQAEWDFIKENAMKVFEYLNHPQPTGDIAEAIECNEKIGKYYIAMLENHKYGAVEDRKRIVSETSNTIRTELTRLQEYENHYKVLRKNVDEVTNPLVRELQSQLDEIREALNDMQIEYDESGYIATTLHTNTIEEQKRILFGPIQAILNKESK